MDTLYSFVDCGHINNVNYIFFILKKNIAMMVIASMLNFTLVVRNLTTAFILLSAVSFTIMSVVGVTIVLNQY